MHPTPQIFNALCNSVLSVSVHVVSALFFVVVFSSPFCDLFFQLLLLHCFCFVFFVCISHFHRILFLLLIKHLSVFCGIYTLVSFFVFFSDGDFVSFVLYFFLQCFC